MAKRARTPKADTPTAAAAAPSSAAAVPPPPPAPPLPLVAIEQLASELRLPEWQARGLARHQRWAPGKQVTKDAYRAALDAWLNGPMG